MKRLIRIACIECLAVVAMTASADVIRVTGDRVCLRAAAKPDAEVVHQVNADTLLEAPDGISENWVKVEAPKAADLWIFAELTKSGVVSVSKAHVRSGAGLNYNVVGTLPRGMKITSRGQTGDWIKIEPPEGTYLFVSKEFVEFVSKSDKKAAPVIISEPPKAEVIDEPVRVRTPPPKAIDSPAPAPVKQQTEPAKKELILPPPRIVDETESKKAPAKTSIWSFFNSGKSKHTEGPAVYHSAAPVPGKTSAKTNASWEDAPVATPAAATQAPKPKAAQTTAKPVVKPVVKPKPVVPPKPKYHEKYFSDDQLAPHYLQGKKGSFEGQLSKAAALLFSPTKYRLVMLDNAGRAVTVCHIAGDNLKLADFIGKRVKIEGRIYWLRSSSYPAIIVEKTTKLP